LNCLPFSTRPFRANDYPFRIEVSSCPGSAKHTRYYFPARTIPRHEGPRSLLAPAVIWFSFSLFLVPFLLVLESGPRPLDLENHLEISFILLFGFRETPSCYLPCFPFVFNDSPPNCILTLPSSRTSIVAGKQNHSRTVVSPFTRTEPSPSL